MRVLTLGFVAFCRRVQSGVLRVWGVWECLGLRFQVSFYILQIFVSGLRVSLKPRALLGG